MSVHVQVNITTPESIKGKFIAIGSYVVESNEGQPLEALSQMPICDTLTCIDLTITQVSHLPH